MKRSIGITLSGVVTLIGSILCLATTTGMVAVAMFMPPPASQPPMAKEMIYVGAAAVLLAGVWGIATAIGLFRLQRWARFSMLIFGGLLVCTSVVSAAMVLLIMPMTQGAMPAEAANWGIAVVLVFYGMLAVVGGWWLYLFNKKSVKEQFLRTEPAKPESGIPLSIAIIGGLMLFGAASCVVAAVMRWPVMLLSLVLTGWAAVAVYALYAVAQAAIGVGLLRLNPLSRVAGLYFFAFALVNNLLFLLLPGRDARMEAAMDAMSQAMKTPLPQMANPPWILGVAVSGVLTILVLWFLVTRKPAFVKPGRMTELA